MKKFLKISLLKKNISRKLDVKLNQNKKNLRLHIPFDYLFYWIHYIFCKLDHVVKNVRKLIIISLISNQTIGGGRKVKYRR